MNACTSRCGYCGRCTDDHHDTPPKREYYTCDLCGHDAFWPVTLAGVGIACCRGHMDELVKKHEAAMVKR